MWWKFYFGLDIILTGISIASLFDGAKQNIPLHIFLIVTYCLALGGLYSFIFKKKFVPLRVWRYYFWFYLLLDSIYFLYGFIPTPYAKYVSFLTVYPESSVEDAVINTALDIPLLFALYNLTKGKFYEKNLQKKVKKTRFQWGMLQMALWGYATILTFFLFASSFFSMNGGEYTKTSAEPTYLISIVVMFAPLLIFWLWILLQYKQYKWNWWRMTLVANALLYSGSIIFGILIPVTDKGEGGFDIISTLQILILLFSLYFFGREQFRISEEEE